MKRFAGSLIRGAVFLCSGAFLQACSSGGEPAFLAFRGALSPAHSAAFLQEHAGSALETRAEDAAETDMEEIGQCRDPKEDETIEARMDGVAVTLMQGIRTDAGDVLVLPGWAHSRREICRQTRFCRRALEFGYRLVLPEMGKSVYQRDIFPETRSDWRAEPGRTWVVNVLIPGLQERYGIFRGRRNFLAGLSTGARGVVLVAMDTGTLFCAGAALSGDYDQTRMPQDRLMRGFYGPYERFSQRWAAVDNPASEAEKLRIPMYFGHGSKDPVVPVSQTRDFFERLKPVVRGASRLHILSAGHDYAYWDSQMDAVFDFFREVRQKTDCAGIH